MSGIRQDIEAIYSLSPFQVEVLACVRATPKPGFEMEQFVASIDGAIDIALLRQSVEHLFRTQAVLRTSLLCQEEEAPVQIVSRVSLGAIVSTDIAALPDFLKRDASQPFELGTAPLVRFCLLQPPTGPMRLVVTYHRALLDRWAVFLLLRNLISSYDRLFAERTVDTGAVNHYRQVLLASKSHIEAHVQPHHAASSLRGFRRTDVTLPDTSVEVLRTEAFRHKSGLVGMFRDLWASVSGDSSFGLVIPGRPPSVAGSESVLGLFANTGSDSSTVDSTLTLTGDWPALGRTAFALDPDAASYIDPNVDAPFRLVIDTATLRIQALYDETRIAPSEAQALLERLASEVASPSKHEPDRSEKIPRVERASDLPVSFSQQRLWFLDQLEPGSVAYHAQGALRLRGALDIGVLRAGLNELVRRHESLRTSFFSRDGELRQVIRGPFELPLLECDLENVSSDSWPGEIQAFATRINGEPFDLTEGPLLRVALIRLGASEHVLLLTIHHIITDGWSRGVFFEELGTLYEAILDGRPSPLPELALQYADYAVWQRKWLAGEAFDEGLGYWKTKLEGAPPLSVIPTDFPRLNGVEWEAGMAKRTLPRELSPAVQALTKREGVTFYMFLLAVLKLLVFRYSGQNDVVIGTPTANRDRQELEAVIGCFVNTLALRTDVSGNPSFLNLLARVRDTALGAFANQQFPFEKIVEALQPSRDLAYNPIFQIFLNVLNLRKADLELSGLEVSPYAVEELPNRFDITLYAQHEMGRIHFELVYNARLYRPESVERILDHMTLLIEQIVESPRIPIGEYSLIRPQDHRALPDVSVPLKAKQCGAIHELFMNRAVLHPDRLAVVGESGSWSYGELNEASTRLAYRLRQIGVQSGETVAIYAAPSASLVCAVLAVLKSGCAFSILDSDNLPQRLWSIAEIASPAAIIVLDEAGNTDEFEALASNQVVLEKLQGASAAEVTANLEPCPDGILPVAVSEEAFAYVAFTSGTTGGPLGVVGTHGPVTHFLEWHTRTFGLEAKDHFSLLSGIAHDPALRDLFTPLAIGASLHIPPVIAKGNGERLLAWLREEGITVAHLTPPLAQIIPPREAAAADLSALRFVFFGGDRLLYGDAQRLHAWAPGCSFVNFYGATETPQAMAWRLLRSPELDDGLSGAPVPLGHPIDSVQLLLLNEQRRLAGVGELAEIWIRTPLLCEGYLDAEQLTRDRFQDCEPMANVRDRMYRSGDLGRYGADGSVEFVARVASHVKVRGFRVDPLEVEAAVEEHPEVRQCAVVVRDEDTETELVAFAVADASVHQVQAFLAERLPRYLLPSRIHIVETLPLTRNGKIDRAALEALGAKDDRSNEIVGPLDDVESRIAGMWTEVLNRAPIGAGDDFFLLGGHSLKAIQVANRIDREFGIPIGVRELFRFPRLRDLSNWVRAATPRRSTPITPAPVAELYLASHAQRRLWTLARLGASTAYNMQRLVLLEGELRVHCFEEALSDVIRRHEALRTTFVAVDGGLWQRIHADLSVSLNHVDCRSELNPSQSALEWAAADTEAEFDLEAGPLLRVALLKVGDDRVVLCFNVHHIVSDAWSLGILIREFARFYEARARGDQTALSPLRIHYKDYAHWQAALLHEEKTIPDRDYWRTKLAGPLAVLDLPADFPRPPVKTYSGGREHFEYDSELATGLHALSRSANATLYMTLSAIVKFLLFRLSGQSDLTVGCPVSGRQHADLENQVGFYVNVLPLRDRVDGKMTFSGLLGSVRQTALDAYAHQDYPFDLLVSELDLVRDVSRSPLFEVAITLQNVEGSELSLPGLEILPFTDPKQTSKFDLNFVFEERAGSIEGYIEYSEALFSRARIRRMTGQLQHAANEVVRDPSQRCGAIEFVPPAESEIIQSANRTDSDYPSDSTIVSLFEERAALRAGSDAVIFEENRLSYDELNLRADLLARQVTVRLAGKPTNQRYVAVFIERSEQMPVVFLAILKAGAAYVPIDTSYPASRVRFILEDCGAALALSETAHLESLRGLFGGEVLDISPTVSESEDTVLPHVSSDDVAYVIYTSGSTGQPKGCAVTHRNVVRLMKNEHFPFDFNETDTWIVAHSFAFDFSVWELYGALLYGGRAVIASRSAARNPAALRELIREHRVTVLNQTPAAFYGMIEVERGVSEHDLEQSLRYVIFGGDRLSPEELRDWVSIYPLEQVRLINMYGITETTVHVTYGPLCQEHIQGGGSISPIGVPLPETRVYVCDDEMNLQPVGVTGELFVGGTGVCRGYLNRPDLNAERFISSPFEAGERLYRTGDLGRWLSDGSLEYVGRNDRQVQIRGHRVELGEVQSALASSSAVREAVVTLWQPSDDLRDVDKRIVAYVVLEPGAPEEWKREVSAHLKATLPDYMVPSRIVDIPSVPLTGNGKTNYATLPSPDSSPPSSHANLVAREEPLAAIWRGVLRRSDVGPDDNFFDLGGHSLLLIEVHRQLQILYEREIALVDLFSYPTIGALAQFLETDESQPGPIVTAAEVRPLEARTMDVAVIGMAGRFPGASNTEEFWSNLKNGVESVRDLSDEELLAAGVSESLIRNPRYVKSKPLLDSIEYFDAEFFGIPDREAAVMDPQHRLFLECAWEALENAGYVPEQYDGRIGVYAGASLNSYLLNNLYSNQDLIESIGVYPVLIGNERDFIATRVCYKLNLTGPGVAVGTACSSSMVAVQLACQALLNSQCSIALAGGVSVKVPQVEGYLYDEGGILSPDGHCRAFDASARGTVSGSGAGIVVLKRLSEALHDGDHIAAVIKGIAVSNDGSAKVGYTAPSVGGQAAAIADAQSLAGVDPDTISLVEAHGTGTSLGDPIELAALTGVFGAGTARTGYCAIGSVKTNIGHLDAAAGVAGLIKTVLSLDRKQIPPSLNFVSPNPAVDFKNSPFFVNCKLRDWDASDSPRRAAVSSFGLGGTNAHAVLEEAPYRPVGVAARTYQLLPLSAPSGDQLEEVAGHLSNHLAARPNSGLGDVAYTLATGRRVFEHRRIVVSPDVSHASGALANTHSPHSFAAAARSGTSVAFLFPGGGAQYINMGRDLYNSEPYFREQVDHCCDVLASELGGSFRSVMYPPAGEETAAAAKLLSPSLGLPALFITEYSLAKLLMSWGIQPGAMIGHSLGEYAAACLAEVLDLKDALRIVAFRGRLFEKVAPGAMLSVQLVEERVRTLLDDSCDIAAVNLPGSCVISGTTEAIENARALFESHGVESHRLHISVAAHSRLVEPILRSFREFLETLTLGVPQIPFLSNTTGTWITDREAQDPAYWTNQLRQTVRFAEGVRSLFDDPLRVLVEVGPGSALTSVVRQHPHMSGGQSVFPTLPHALEEGQSSVATVLTGLGRLWIEGVPVDWKAFYSGQEPARVPLPGLSFNRKRLWIEPRRAGDDAGRGSTVKRAHVDDWFYTSAWRRAMPPVTEADSTRSWLILSDGGAVASGLAERLGREGHEVDLVEHPDVASLLADRAKSGCLPDRIIDFSGSAVRLNRIATAWKDLAPNRPILITEITCCAHDVTGDEAIDPLQGAVRGPVVVIGQENAYITCRSIDVGPEVAGEPRLTELLGNEILSSQPDMFVAFRHAHRWTLAHEPLRIPVGAGRLRKHGVYLITGGTGGVGAILARYLARTQRARLVLFSRHAETSGVGLAEEIERLGGEALLLSGDVSRPDDVFAAVQRTRTRYGDFDGVIHAAGTTSGSSIFTPFEELEESHFVEQSEPKLGGARALAKALEGVDLDFVLLISSNATVLGGLGLAAYAAANCAMDAFALVQNRRGVTRWITSAWDGWPTLRRERIDSSQATAMDRMEMTLEESEMAFSIVVGAPTGGVVVSSHDLFSRLDRWKDVSENRTGDKTEQSGQQDEPGTQAPQDGSIEGRLVALWKEMLGTEHIGNQESFFELRGDSLLGSRMITRLNSMFGSTLPLKSLFESPTILGLAQKIRGETESVGSRIPRAPDQDRYTLSRAQRRLWLLCQFEEGSRAYHIPLVVRLDGDLDRAALARAFTTIIGRHESLRTRFVSNGEDPVQEVLSDISWEMPFSDLSSADDAESASVCEAKRFSGLPFALDRAPLMRAQLIRLAPKRHELHLVLHHIVADGWSLSILSRELRVAYNAFRGGTSPDLPSLRLQYRDFSYWQNRFLESDEASRSASYWDRQLAGELPVLDLPADFPRPSTPSFEGDMLTLALGSNFRARIEAFATAHRATPFMALYSVLVVLLHRYSGSMDVVVGTPVAGRSHPDLEDQIGFYLNTIVLRSRIDPDVSFAEFLRQVRATCLDAYENESHPFDDVVDRDTSTRDLSHSPLFDVLISLQNAGAVDLKLDGIAVEAVAIPNKTAKYDLSFDFAAEGDDLLLGLRYRTDLFSRERIERMAAHFFELADHAITNPEVACGKLNIVPGTERSKLMTSFQGATLPLANEVTLLDLLEEHVRKTPHNAAVSFEDRTWTYQEVDSRSTEIAAYLMSRSEAAETVAAVCLERSMDLLAALLGILKAGFAYVPIDPAYPDHRCIQMLQDSGASVVLVDADTEGRVEELIGSEETKSRILPLHKSIETDNPRPLPKVGASQLAYVLYTSGSTGVPKGVEVEHGALANLLLSFKEMIGMTDKDAFLSLTTVSFDIAGLELYLPLISGGLTVIASSAMAVDGEAIGKRLARGDITLMQGTPSTWRMLLAAGWKGSPELTILCGGEALHRGLASSLFARCGRFWNVYGPTESTIWSTACRIDSNHVAEGAPPVVSIGKAIHNTSVYVLDRWLQPSALGVPGELFIGGVGLARGYRGQKMRTRERFITDGDGRRLYRTGDVVRFDSTGLLEFLGRTDHQVKVRGHRVETGEVEAALCRHESVQEAAVVCVSNDEGETALAAYIVAFGTVEASALRSHLKMLLPAYMTPSAFVTLDALPLAANGKVDRSALPEPSAFSSEAAFEEPRDAMEVAIGTVWEQVLDVRPISIHDDFFRSGGHSLAATRAVFRLQKELNVPVTMMELFRNPTIASLASLLRARPRSTEIATAASGSSDHADPVSLTPDELELLRFDE